MKTLILTILTTLSLNAEVFSNIEINSKYEMNSVAQFRWAECKLYADMKEKYPKWFVTKGSDCQPVLKLLEAGMDIDSNNILRKIK